MPIKRKAEQMGKDMEKNNNNIRYHRLATNAISTKSTHNINFLTNWTPTQVKEYIWRDKLEGPIRDYIEPVTADAQCHRAGIDFNNKTTTCWLCGCVIGNESKACEHILPALRAVMLTGMITSNKIMRKPGYKTANHEKLDMITKANYLWAHDDCNGSSAKSGMVLLKLNGNMFVPDKVKCNILQSKISQIPGRLDCYKKFRTDKRFPTIFNRLEEEMKSQCQTINQELDEFKKYDKSNYMNSYIEYTINVIKLYANSDALKLLSSAEESDKLNADRAKELQRLAHEQQELKMKSEESYGRFLKKLISFNQSLLTYKTADDVPVSSIVRVHCSNFLSRPNLRRGKEDFITPPYEIGTISANVTRQIIPIIRGIFEKHSATTTNSSFSIGFIYSIVDFFAFSFIYKEALERSLAFYYQDKEPKNAEQFHEIQCLFLFVIIQKIKDSFYSETVHDVYYKELNENPVYNHIKSYITKADIDICQTSIAMYIAKYLIDVKNPSLSKSKSKSKSQSKENYGSGSYSDSLQRYIDNYVSKSKNNNNNLEQSIKRMKFSSSPPKSDSPVYWKEKSVTRHGPGPRLGKNEVFSPHQRQLESKRKIRRHLARRTRKKTSFNILNWMNN